MINKKHTDSAASESRSISISFVSELLCFATSGTPLLSLIIVTLLLKLRRAPSGDVNATHCCAASAKIKRLYITSSVYMGVVLE